MNNLFDVYPLYDITPVKAEGNYVFDEKGTKYLDLYGGHAVISIGHGHPVYKQYLKEQIDKIGFYSNSIKNPMQEELAEKLLKLSGLANYKLFLCNSGAEANENALKLASFHTGKDRVIYFSGAFHGRTSGAVAVTENENIKAPFNKNQKVTRVVLGDTEKLQQEISKGDVAAVIFESIQGVGGLDEAETEFYRTVTKLAHENGAAVIADEVQSGYGRTGDFFAFQKHGIDPDIISIAKGMGNGFPVGGVLIADHIKASYGLLGTTFGGNHLACAAGIAVLDVIANENLLQHAKEMGAYFEAEAKKIPQIKKIKGRGLMLGIEFNFSIAELRKTLLFEHHIFTGSAANKNLLRILPALNIGKPAIDSLFSALQQELKK